MATLDDEQSPITFDNTLFPSDGSHYRAEQLDTIWRLFGVSAPVLPDLRLRQRVNELVENRNAIAHGRRTARDVGARHTNKDMEARIDDTDAITHHVIDTMETHCLTGGLESA